ncbi:hypothetical protein ACS0TY_022618 [Phlomoides rotata]
MGKSSHYVFAYAVLFLTLRFSCLANITTDKSALLSLKAHLTLHPHHILAENWTHTSSVCNWIGVTCSLRHHRVSALNISDMSLSGTITPELGNLSFLISLDLRYNLFRGILPQELSLLHRLKFISIRNNNFEGEIPAWFGHLPKLEYMSLRNNTFSGFIPNSLSNLSSLYLLSLSFNQLSGSIQSVIFNMCGKLPNLEVMSLSYNHLSDRIPSNLSQCTQLKMLYLGGNNLNGVIPQEIGNLHNLVEFGTEDNQISGALPLSIFNMTSLQILLLWRNKLSGKLSRDIGNLTMLTDLELSENYFTGFIPTEIGQLYQLNKLALRTNTFTGSIPLELFNISALVQLDLGQNGMSGSLPSNLCISSPNLEWILVGQNNISGAIPASVSSCAKLTALDLDSNDLSGFVPHSLGNLTRLFFLSLQFNNLRFESPASGVGFFTSLTSLTSLKLLAIGDNPLGGVLSPSIGNLSSSLQIFDAPYCNFKGTVPNDIGNLTNLVSLQLRNNDLSGIIPPTFTHLHTLQGLNLGFNLLSGIVPEDLCDLHNLVELDLGFNRLSGPIPTCLGNVSSLGKIFLNSNMLTSTIPSTLWDLKDLLTLDLSSNSFTGFLPPEIANLVTANYINLSMNNLSESIPNTIGKLQNLVNLSLAHNRLKGSIPASVGSMVGLVTLDLSNNNLSGSIPKSLEALRYLLYFNVSFNTLNGEIPSGGPFRNFTLESFTGNDALCGNQTFFPGITLCPAVSRHKSIMKKVKVALFILTGVVVLVTVVTLAFIFIRRTRKDKAVSRFDELASIVPQRISYFEILQATQQFNESNLLGIGGYGSVYRGILRDGKAIAVKVFNTQSEASFNSFDVECEVLRNIRHRNLTKVLSSCSNPDFKALVLEYMPNASLEKWLYSHNLFLDARQRLDILIDVASALEYLHHDYSTPIVHCDLKPSNVLLDEEMIAHVCDFGISKLLGDEESTVLTNTLATLGYIAPEYGLEGIVSTRCDVYSYGVMLMETFTRKRPSDMFGGDLSLKSWIESLLPHSPDRVIDVNLFIDLEIGQLYQLNKLLLHTNAFTGSIPLELFNISALVAFDLGQNGLSGSLPSNLCISSPNLEWISVGLNNISGAIPASVSSCANLTVLDLGNNDLSGFVPHFLGNLTRLFFLGLEFNNLRFESSASTVGFFTSLTSLTSLNVLTIGGNPLGGVLPPYIGNLSSSLQTFLAPYCNFKGTIPKDIGNLTNLVSLQLHHNDLSGIIPPTFTHLHTLQGLNLNNNNLEGLVPENLCDLHNLVELDLRFNRLSGPIPTCLGNVSSLRNIFLNSNMLTSTIPSTLWDLKDLLTLDLSSNSFTGFLPPEIANLVAANYINLSMNNLSESIPNTIGKLQNLVNFSLAHNRLKGSIPASVGTMVGLVTLDLSNNNLSGSIPKSLEVLRYLLYFNVSFNTLNGEIPSGGPFRNFTLESFTGNDALCGNQTFFPGIPLCPDVSRHKSTRKKVHVALFILTGVVVLVMVVTLAFIFLRRTRKDEAVSRVDELASIIPQRMSYYEILQATQQFDESNLLGIGSYGSVYRGILRDGKAIAVKVFNTQSEAAFKSFDVECEVLRNIRHRNLTKVFSSCSNPDFKALVLEYIPNASLEKWFYSHNLFLDARQRLDILIDVASALEYLHHGYSTPIVHCDLKPSNVLLDEEMIAHVCDFGISKVLLGDEESTVLTNTLATLGYIAPEYGLEGIVSTRSDMYSYGVMLMETFTRKRPSDMFGGDLSLKCWIESLLPQSPDQVIDVNLFIDLGDERSDNIIECVSSILVVALKCSAESPRERINIKEALAELQRIKHGYFKKDLKYKVVEGQVEV